MNDMELLANVLSIMIPYFFIALWVLVPIAVIWTVVRYVKKGKKSDEGVKRKG
jgi:hypothetical protein